MPHVQAPELVTRLNTNTHQLSWAQLPRNPTLHTCLHLSAEITHTIYFSAWMKPPPLYPNIPLLSSSEQQVPFGCLVRKPFLAVLPWITHHQVLIPSRAAALCSNCPQAPHVIQLQAGPNNPASPDLPGPGFWDPICLLSPPPLVHHPEWPVIRGSFPSS